MRNYCGVAILSGWVFFALMAFGARPVAHFERAKLLVPNSALGEHPNSGRPMAFRPDDPIWRAGVEESQRGQESDTQPAIRPIDEPVEPSARWYHRLIRWVLTQLGLSNREGNKPAAVATTQLESAVEKAVQYLLSKKRRIDEASLPLLFFLGRKFCIPELLPFGDLAKRRLSSLPPQDRRRALIKMIDPYYQTNEAELARLQDSDVMLGAALHCHEHRQPQIGTILRTSMENGGYKLTHASLALQWFKERGCDIPGGPSLIEKAAQQMAAELRQYQVATDLAIELAAFLHYLGHGECVDDIWVSRVLQAQKADGGWSRDPTSRWESSWHTTGLALFFLLEASRPSVPSIPMFVQ